MISTVSPAAAALRSTQSTCAPSRAKVTAVALPLPQPGPIDPAPTTIAVLPLSRSIDFLSLCVLVFLFPGLRFAPFGLRIFANAHRRDADGIAENIRQCPTFSNCA